MNFEQARKLPLPDVLARLGYNPTKTAKQGQEFWYESPLREERTPSFHTTYRPHLGIWIWKDFGDTGGTVLDFAMRYYNTDLKGTLYYLDRLMGNTQQQSLFSIATATKAPPPATSLADEQETLVARKITPFTGKSFQGRALMQYIAEKRAINPDIATRYLLEILYKNNNTGKDYFALGMKNEAGGYEIRNPYYQSVIGSKSITCINGQGNEQVSVFEGFIDFLSALTYFQKADVTRYHELLQGDTIIMNSVNGLYERTLEKIKLAKYTKAHLYLDHDNTGYKIRDSFLAELPGIAFDCSSIYQGYGDFNDFLKANQDRQNLNR